MHLTIDFSSAGQQAIISSTDTSAEEWKFVGTIIGMKYPNFITNDNCYFVPWKPFISIRQDIAVFCTNHRITLSVTDEARKMLLLAIDRSYRVAVQQKHRSPDEIVETLKNKGFARQLTNNQLFNLSKIAALPGAATFSVPGAGKTTEALAYFFLNADEEDHLLVVAPKNAFGAWDEQLRECMPSEKREFVRLRGGEANITALLSLAPKYAIISYQQYPRVTDLILNYLKTYDTFMFLDESHRIKSGRNIVSADAILDASYLPKRKLIMSGTPMPQSQKDLVPQFEFLYPEVVSTPESVVNDIQPVFVRTSAGQLGIPAVTRKVVTLQMGELQTQIYRTIKSEMKRQMIPYLSDLSRVDLRRIGASIMKVLQFVSNPGLLSGDLQYAFDDRIIDLLLQTSGPKIDYVCRRARELASEGRKVLIWSSFVANVELITLRLQDIGADYIHGGVDAGSDEEEDTREWKIKEFHNNPEKMVLVANPAAASEGISLHRICQYAIYLDRNFNAAQYLQSEDRIHRLGLKQDQHPIVEIVECADTIDQLVNQRLTAKVERMASVLNDTSLSIEADSYDYIDDEDGVGLTTEDLRFIKDFFGGDSP